MVNKSILSIAVCIILIGCTATVSFTPTGKTYPPYNGPVKIYESAPENLNFTEVGWVTSEGDWNNAWGDLLKLLQQEAAKNGANAIIIVESNYKTSNYEYRLQDERQSGGRSIIAKAIKILDD